MADRPEDIAVLRAALAAAERRADLAETERDAAVADAAHAKATASGVETTIARPKLQIEKLRRELSGTRSERTARLLEQLEMQLEDAAAALSEDELAAEPAAKKETVARLERRRRGGRKPFPADLPRERVVVSGPIACVCCGSNRLRKPGEDVTETPERDPAPVEGRPAGARDVRRRDCERISQPPAPFHATPRGLLGPNLLAAILLEKFGQHQPPNRQSDRFQARRKFFELAALAASARRGEASLSGAGPGSSPARAGAPSAAPSC